MRRLHISISGEKIRSNVREYIQPIWGGRKCELTARLSRTIQIVLPWGFCDVGEASSLGNENIRVSLERHDIRMIVEACDEVTRSLSR